MLVTSIILVCGYATLGHIDDDCKMQVYEKDFYSYRDCREFNEQKIRTLEFGKQMNKRLRGLEVVGTRCILWRELGEPS